MRVAWLFCCATACSGPIEVDWKQNLRAGSVSTPLVTPQFIAAGHERGVAILEPKGSVRCDFDARGEVVAKPATDGKLLFFGSTNYIFYAIDPTCREVWKFPTRDRIKSDALVEGGRVYLSSYDGHVYALTAERGELVWQFPQAPGTTLLAVADSLVQRGAATTALPSVVEAGDFSYSSPALERGVLYVGNLDHHLYAIEVTQGTLKWRYETGGAVTSSPRVQNGRVYFGSNDAHVYAVDTQSGALVWKQPTGDWVNSSPCLDGDTLYIGSNDRQLYALELNSGALKWKTLAKGPLIAIPAVYKNLVFAAGGSGDGALYAFSKATGELFWQHTTSGKIESDPVVVADNVYVTSTDRHLYAFAVRQTTAK